MKIPTLLALSSRGPTSPHPSSSRVESSDARLEPRPPLCPSTRSRPLLFPSPRKEVSTSALGHCRGTVNFYFTDRLGHLMSFLGTRWKSMSGPNSASRRIHSWVSPAPIQGQRAPPGSYRALLCPTSVNVFNDNLEYY